MKKNSEVIDRINSKCDEKKALLDTLERHKEKFPQRYEKGPIVDHAFKKPRSAKIDWKMS